MRLLGSVRIEMDECEKIPFRHSTQQENDRENSTGFRKNKTYTLKQSLLSWPQTRARACVLGSTQT